MDDQGGDLDFNAAWETLTIKGQTGLDSAATIPMPPPEGALEVHALPPVLVAGDDDRPAELALGKTLGEGGMGLVREAVQVPLRRDVAVKTVRDARKSEAAARGLLREAWLTGGLEHPNIIPVYFLGRSDDGAPVLVMKRVEGTTWSAILKDEKKGLGWHIDVLLAVARAIDFAHSKGIVHRDIKPENVMLGAFGEIYVLDWGIAVSLKEEDAGRIPLARDIQEIAGTPCYMAPEMAGIRAAEIGPATDVYLLGATLHEILTGAPPHKGPMYEALESAYHSEPRTYPSSVPAELAELCRKAMHRDPKERFADAGALIAALEDFKEHRQSLEISRRAQEGLDKLLAALAEEAPDEIAVSKRFAECRFGFEQALRSWEGNAEARAGLDRSLAVMTGFELTRRNHAMAARYLAKITEPDPELARRVRELGEETRREEEAIERLKRDQDRATGSRARSTVAIVFAVLWTGLPLIDGQLYRAGELGSGLIFLAPLGALLLMMLGFNYYLRRSGVDTPMNRRLGRSLLIVWGILVAHRLTGLAAGLEPIELVRLEFLLFTTVTLLIANFVEPRLWPAGVIFIVGAILATAAPSYTFEFIGGCNGLVMLITIWVWRGDRAEEKSRLQES